LGNLITGLHGIAGKQSAKGGNFLFHFAVLHRINGGRPSIILFVPHSKPN
jgi:hypothetical protein